MSHQPQIVSKAEYGREWNVSTAAVIQWAKAWLAPAVTPHGIDRAHPIAQKGPPNRQRNPNWVPMAGTRVGAAKLAGTDQDLDELTKLLEPLIERFGTGQAFKEWLNSLKIIEDIRGKRISNDESEQSLISRELVRAHVFSLIDETNRKLLADAPKTIARLIYSEAKAGRPVEDAEEIARKQISAQLKALKTRAKKALAGNDNNE